MKIAVSAIGDSLDSRVSQIFGRCPYFLIIDSDTMKFEVVSNPGEGMVGGAGPEAAQLVSSHGVQAVLTGAVGPNAKSALDAAGIKIAIGLRQDITVSDAVKQYMDGKLSS